MKVKNNAPPNKYDDTAMEKDTKKRRNNKKTQCVEWAVDSTVNKLARKRERFCPIQEKLERRQVLQLTEE